MKTTIISIFFVDNPFLLPLYGMPYAPSEFSILSAFNGYFYYRGKAYALTRTEYRSTAQ